jgi:hypothetical protein
MYIVMHLSLIKHRRYTTKTHSTWPQLKTAELNVSPVIFSGLGLIVYIIEEEVASWCDAK